MKLLEHASEDTDGHLVYEATIYDERGGTTTHDVDVTALLTPGTRRTGDANILLAEAERAAAGECPTNAAIPVDQATARTVMQRLDARGIEPAWKVCAEADFPPRGGDGT